MNRISNDLIARLAKDTWPNVQRWLERDHPDILTRINRLTVVDDQYRLDGISMIVPPSEMKQVPAHDGAADIFRGCPPGALIRPGDWVSLSREYAGQHGERTNDIHHVDVLTRVDATDIYWAGTDMREFFYLPSAWRKDGASPQEYLQNASPEALRSLCDGERSSLTEHSAMIGAIREHVLAHFDEDACGTYHGPDHWARVAENGLSVARSLGIDPLVPYIFGLVHDSQRLDDGRDPQHGPRAADFILHERHGLFAPLDDVQIQHLAHACKLHSDGYTDGHEWVQACWDSDRLDLGRVDICPDPEYLCTDYAKRDDVIVRALKNSNAEHLIEELQRHSHFMESDG